MIATKVRLVQLPIKFDDELRGSPWEQNGFPSKFSKPFKGIISNRLLSLNLEYNFCGVMVSMLALQI